jgi:hypothetical protein
LNRQQLHVLLRKARELSGHQEFVIVGSLSILGAVSDPPDAMVGSIDVDTYMKADPGRTGDLSEALGQGRLIEIDFGDVRAYFVEPNDVAVSKYMRGEERDLRWLRAGLKSKLLNMDIIERRIGSAPALDGELPAARKRISAHRKSLKLFNG